MQEKSPEAMPEFRIRTVETSEQIAAEVSKCAGEGRIVCYFNDAATLNLWRLRVEALSG
jgi:hypothetical protein